MMDIRNAKDGGIEIGRLFEPGHPRPFPPFTSDVE